MRQQIQGKIKILPFSNAFNNVVLSSLCLHKQVILGHHFVDYQAKSIPTTKQHCDNCTGIIWSVVQASYICIDCNFCVHHKCVTNVIRVCANVIASERKEPLDEICPENGLSFQRYKCAECHASLSFSKCLSFAVLPIDPAKDKFDSTEIKNIPNSFIHTCSFDRYYRFPWMVLLLGIA